MVHASVRHNEYLYDEQKHANMHVAEASSIICRSQAKGKIMLIAKEKNKGCKTGKRINIREIAVTLAHSDTLDQVRSP